MSTVAANPRHVPPADRLPRLLPQTAVTEGFSAHCDRLGELPRLASGQLTQVLHDAGLTGRGGAAFPTFRKLQAVASGRGAAVVIGNGAEGEPASSKDRLLLSLAPHLVLDGLQLVAAEIRARQAYVYVPREPEYSQIIEGAIEERDRHGGDVCAVSTVAAPDRFIAGQESAAAHRVAGGYAIPRSAPPVYERGVRGRPTLVSNVETLAQIALIARFGPRWFRALGTSQEPGTMLYTVSGAVARPIVVEVPLGSALTDVVAAAGGPTEPVSAILIGGYHGGWLPAAANGSVPAIPMLNAELRRSGLTLGAGVLVLLPASRCGLAETARVARYLAAESAGQCGPCANGLPRIAELCGQVGTPGVASAAAVREIRRLSHLVVGRGACHHPDGSVRFLHSALRTFAAEIELHARKRCSATDDRSVLPILPGPSDSWDWR